MRASALLIGLAIVGVVALALLALTLMRLGGIEERVAATESSVVAIDAIDSGELDLALEDLRTAISDELATIRLRGVVPTDSSGVILDRLDALKGALDRIDEMADTLADLRERLDQICEGVPVC
ncbi:MAG: hypothetical protein ABI534_04635 [Chloroflexota bacterium]